MTAWHLLKLWGSVAVVGIATAGGLLLWPLVWPSDPEQSFALVNGRLVGETEGFVWRVESDRQRIHVTSSLLGLRAMPITVTPETKVVVHDKLGGLGDIWKGMDVRVAYELRDDARFATAVELLTSKSRRSGTMPMGIVVPANAAEEAAPVPPAPAAPKKVVRPHAAAPASASPPPGETDAADGTAAVDWLIRGARR